MQLLLTNKRGPYFSLVGPFCEGVIGPLLQRSGRTLWQALDQPIKTNPPGGWIQAANSWSSWLDCHFWLTTTVVQKWQADSNSMFLLTLTVLLFLFLLIREGAENGRRTDPTFEMDPLYWWPKTEHMDCLDPGWEKLIRKCNKTIMNLVKKLVKKSRAEDTKLTHVVWYHKVC